MKLFLINYNVAQSQIADMFIDKNAKFNTSDYSIYSFREKFFGSELMTFSNG